MSLYQCEQCGCIENTALGQFHSRNMGIYPEPYSGKKLCSECGSPTFTDGSKTKYGKWHGRFKKRVFPLGSLYTDEQGNVRDKSTGEYPVEANGITGEQGEK